MRISDAKLQRARRVPVRDVVERLNIPKAGGRKNKWECPLCGDDNGFHVYRPGDGAYCYFCEASPDAIGIVEAACGVDFPGAVQWLAKEFGFGDVGGGSSADLKAARQRREERRKKREREKKERHARARPILNELWRHMWLGPTGRDYVESRNIPWQVARDVGIRSVGTDRIWERLRSKVWPDELLEAGLTGRKDGDTYPLPWRAPFLVIPYFRPDGTVDILRFRDLSGESPAKYLSPRGLQPSVAYLSEVDWSDEYDTLYVTEGELDALSVLSAAPAVGAPGSGMWRTEWSKSFRWYEQVVVLCDGDAAGLKFSRKVARKTSEVLGRDWVEQNLKRKSFANEMDANQALQEGRLRSSLHV